MNRNYQKELDQLILNIDANNKVPSLLLHSCCAPCSSSILEYLSQYFAITIYYYNPNIYPEEEYQFRAEEQRKFIQRTNPKYPIEFIEGAYEPQLFYDTVAGMEQMPEGGSRCHKCYKLRMRQAATVGRELGFDYFTTTLSISPHKNAVWINEIGEMLEEEFGIKHLPSDFKKKNGFKRSVELTNEYGMYRQDYCGCAYSLRDRERTINSTDAI